MSTHLHGDDNVYDSLAEALGGEERWAYGTGFTDPFAHVDGSTGGIDAPVPAGVHAPTLARQCLALGDDALVLSQRLGLWVSNAPELEDEVALANIALDLLGQARLLLSRAAHVDASLRPTGAPEHIADEDALAYFRDPAAFANARLAELDDAGDFARCVARLFVLVSWRLALVTRLEGAPDPVLAAIAVKSATELTYHREYAAGWLVRLGDGTEFSHARMRDALDWIRPCVTELPASAPFGADDVVTPAWTEFAGVVREVLDAATLTESMPLVDPAMPMVQRPLAEREPVDHPVDHPGAVVEHTAALTELLAQLQGFARANPEAVW